MSRQTVSKWELGDTTPELEKLHLLCDYFQISMDELTGRRGPGPAAPVQAEDWRNWHYEYQSEKKLFGLPLVHFNVGAGGRPYKARGIFAVGNIAQGVVAMGAIAMGLLSLGGVSLGLLALGGFAVGLLAIAGISVGAVALGAIAFGLLAIGSIALGVYARGAIAMEWGVLLLHLLRLIMRK